MPYPRNYEWLARVGTLPKVITEGLKLIGTREVAGSGNSPVIMSWVKETGNTLVFTSDAVPWCGLYVDVVCKRAGKSRIKNPAWALNWSKIGSNAGQPILGDILTFTREGGGHVGFYIGEDKECYHVLGGNQSDSVSIVRIYKRRLHAARRLPFQFFLPPSARPYSLSSAGAPVSVKET